MSDTGDLRDCSDDTLQSLLDQVNIICASALNDWEIYPGRGSGIDDFIGEPNIPQTATRIRDRLRLALVSAELVKEEDLYIRVFPVHIHKMMIVIRVDAIPSGTNKLRTKEKVQSSLVFDTISHQAFFLDKTPQLLADS
jgi:hypothetical protein